MWDVSTPDIYLVDEIRRPDTAGLNLSEIRLKSGFINVVVPFILAINIRDIYEISHSEEMRPWRVLNSYDRPIARRIAETAGVPRGAFGIRKKQVVAFRRYPINNALRNQFFVFLEKEYALTRRVVPPEKAIFWRKINMPFLMWMWSTKVLAGQLSTTIKHKGVPGHVINDGSDSTK